MIPIPIAIVVSALALCAGVCIGVLAMAGLVANNRR